MLRKLIPSLTRFGFPFDASAVELMAAVRAIGLEGIVAKRSDSPYKPGSRSVAWVKVRANRGQEFAIGGYLPGSTTFGSILVGYYQERDLMYAARIRNGFTPASPRTLREFRWTVGLQMPVSQPPGVEPRTLGRRLTAEDMRKCRWLKPQLFAVIEFLEWTPDDKFLEPKFVSFREDKNTRQVRRE